jgi:triosephosphate isomerase
MRTRLVAGNWKMNGSFASNQALVEKLVRGVGAGSECALCVPFPYLQQVAGLLKGSAIALGAQNVNEHASGAHTGETSASMLVELGCRIVLVGHSERRQIYGETDAQVAAKFKAAQAAGIVPMLCVGETLAEREAGTTESTVARQVDAVIAAAGVAALEQAVLAYEPVWAIGTGKTASPEQAQEVHAFLRRRVAAADTGVSQGLRILYGGSVKAANAAAIFKQPDVDGGLIGGASLVADDFLGIVRAAGSA